MPVNTNLSNVVDGYQSTPRRPCLRCAYRVYDNDGWPQDHEDCDLGDFGLCSYCRFQAGKCLPVSPLNLPGYLPDPY